MSPAKSGVMLIPGLAAYIIAIMIAGPTISAVGWYVPFMLAGSILMPIAAGLLTTLDTDATIAMLIGYNAFFSAAGGIGFQGPQIAVQTTLSDDDTSMGLAMIIFAQNFGPALSLNIAQSIFSSRLTKNLATYAPTLNATAVENLGFSDLKAHVPAKDLGVLLLSFDKAITQTFYLGVALTCLTMIGSLRMEWRSVKEKRS
ncbi:hypothetical protein MBLNU459_g4162t2 [Dothideomycetes sp. NU459]